MTGKIDSVTSGMEDLTSLSHKEVSELADSLQTRESKQTLLSMFFPAKATKEEIEAAYESVSCTLPSPTAGDGCGEQCERRPALASKVIDPDGNTRITILYDGNRSTGGGETGMFTGLIDAAAENDIVDITIMTTLFDFAAPKCNIFATLSLMSAIRRCKAKRIITRAGCLCSIGDCALWLSGTERHMSPMGWVAVKQPTAMTGGTMKDVEFRVEDMKDQLKVFTDYIVDKGLLTADEVTRMYEEQAIIGLSYDTLQERLKSLKPA